jgi:hypothetical protein
VRHYFEKKPSQKKLWWRGSRCRPWTWVQGLVPPKRKKERKKKTLQSSCLFRVHDSGVEFTLFIYCGTGVWTQVLHLESFHQSFFRDGFLQDRVSPTIYPGWLWTQSLLISASWVAKITDMSHQPLVDNNFNSCTEEKMKWLLIKFIHCITEGLRLGHRFLSLVYFIFMLSGFLNQGLRLEKWHLQKSPLWTAVIWLVRKQGERLTGYPSSNLALCIEGLPLNLSPKLFVFKMKS